MPETSGRHGRSSHHGHKHSSGKRKDLDPQNRDYPILSWFCCNCDSPATLSVALHDQCIKCQHTRCESCGLEGGKNRVAVARGSGVETSYPRRPTIESSDNKNTLQLSTETTEILKRLEQLKSKYKKTFVEAARNHRQENFAAPSDPGTTLEKYLQNVVRPSEFVFAWEWSILPFLVEILPKFLGRGYAIHVRRDARKHSGQTICFTSRVKPTRVRRMIIAQHTFDVIPQRFYLNTSFEFYHGKVEFIKRGKDKDNWDDVRDPRNPYHYRLPMMGDSIGPSTGGPATLGPCLKFGDRCFWLANLHVFLKQVKSQAHQNVVHHPGAWDENACGHSIKPSHVKFGTVCASSGIDLTTTMVSGHPFWKRFPPKTLHEVVTDWVLIDDFGHTVLVEEENTEKQMPLPNTLRTPGHQLDPCVTVTKVSPVLPEANIQTTGRTSGYQSGKICQIPAYVDADHDRGTTRPTREWFIEESTKITNPEEHWLEGGIGVPGDSGAPVIDATDNTLYGQIWGRNKYWGDGSRIAYFTAVGDISEDIQAKYSELQSAVELPQLSSRARPNFLSELYCPECVNAEDKDTLQSGSDVISIMAISSVGRSDPQRSDDLRLKIDEPAASGPGAALTTSSPSGDEDFEVIDYHPPASQMALHLNQFSGHMHHDFELNDDTLSIDDEDYIPMRSCAAKKPLRSAIPGEGLPDSWVLVVQTKQKEDTERPARLHVKREIRGACSEFYSLTRTGEASGINGVIYTC